MDLITEFIFGISTDSQVSSGANASQSGSFQYHWDAAATYFEVRALLGSRTWLYNPQKFQEHCRGIHDIAGQLVTNAIARKKRQGRERAEKDSGKFAIVIARYIAWWATFRFLARLLQPRYRSTLRRSRVSFLVWDDGSRHSGRIARISHTKTPLCPSQVRNYDQN